LSEFERNLHEALRRREAPPGFETKVLARTREMEQAAKTQRAWAWSWRWATAAAMLVAIFVAFPAYRERQRQAEAEKSRDELLLALRITNSKLRLVQEKLSGMEQKTIELPLQQ
jgi:hypothetical protein